MTRPQPSLGAASDRDLYARVQRRETAALACLYDRYAPFVFTLLCDAAPDAAESLLEDVFVKLWSQGPLAVRASLLPMLLHLTAEAVVQHRTARGQPLGTVWGRPLLPALAPFNRLPDEVFDVLVLACLGGLTCSDLAIALACDTSVIYRRLSTGVATLRAERMLGELPVGVTAHAGDVGGPPP